MHLNAYMLENEVFMAFWIENWLNYCNILFLFSFPFSITLFKLKERNLRLNFFCKRRPSRKFNIVFLIEKHLNKIHSLKNVINLFMAIWTI